MEFQRVEYWKRPVVPRTINYEGEEYINVKQLKTMVQQSMLQKSPDRWTLRALVRYLELICLRQNTCEIIEKGTLTTEKKPEGRTGQRLRLFVRLPASTLRSMRIYSRRLTKMRE